MKLRRIFQPLGILTLLALAAGLAPGPQALSAGGAGMTLGGPDVMLADAGSYTFTVNADPTPKDPVSAFTSEVEFPTGLQWVPRANCADELVATVGGAPPALCAHGVGLADQARHFAATAISVLPLLALDTPLSTLLELDVECTAAGTHTMTLTTLDDVPYGAVYWDNNGAALPVDTLVVGGRDVADTHDVICLDPLLDEDQDGLSNADELNVHLTDPLVADTDLDGCTDGQELGPDPALGGGRDPLFFWDFFDVPTGDPLARNGSVSGLDFFALLGRFGSQGDPGIDPLSPPPPAPDYHTSYDHASTTPTGAFGTSPPDGAVSGLDTFAMLSQIGHQCY